MSQWSLLSLLCKIVLSIPLLHGSKRQMLCDKSPPKLSGLKYTETFYFSWSPRVRNYGRAKPWDSGFWIFHVVVSQMVARTGTMQNSSIWSWLRSSLSLSSHTVVSEPSMWSRHVGWFELPQSMVASGQWAVDVVTETLQANIPANKVEAALFHII